MLDGAPITYWIGFHLVILFLIVADLTVLSLGKASARTRDSIIFCPLCLCPRYLFRPMDRAR